MKTLEPWIASLLLIAGLCGLVYAGVARVEVKGKEYQTQVCFDLKPGDSLSYSVAVSSVTKKNSIRPKDKPETACIMVFK